MNDEIGRARLYLTLQPDELENVRAEHAKWEARRKTALAYGDSGSPTEPVEFAPFCCRSCDDAIDEYNRSPITGQCVVCLQEQTALRLWQQAEDQRAFDAKFTDKAGAAFWSAAIATTCWFIVLCAGAGLLGIAVAKLADVAMWAIGGGK